MPILWCSEGFFVKMEDIANILGVLGFFVAIISLIVSVWQYKLHRRQMRAEVLSKYCARYCIDKNITAVVKFLEKEEGLSHKYNVKEPDDHEVEMFMRYFEELELMIRAKSIDEDVASYMFFHYLQTFDKLKEKWKNVEYESDDWKVFHEFYARMKKVREDKKKYKID